MTPDPKAPDAPPALELQVLGPMQLVSAGEVIALPRSKKCRALLGYLAVTGRAHRRDRLCSLFWDVADDPRGALRWTLSRLRSVMPEGVDPFEASRESIALRRDVLPVDADALPTVGTENLAALDVGALEAAATRVRGELLEGLELPDFLDFTAWCVAERESVRRVHRALLAELVERLADEPARALGWARRWVQADSLDVTAQRTLLELLLAEGFDEEALRRKQHAVRQLNQVAPEDADGLDRAFRIMRSRPAAPRTAAGQTTPAATPAPVVPSAATAPREPSTASGRAEAADVDAAPAPFVGRTRVIEQVRALLGTTASDHAHALLVTAEPGAGKTRLLDRARREAEQLGLAVRAARAFDLERGRPFGPWIDALGIPPQSLVAGAEAGGRAQLFSELASRVAEAAQSGDGIVLAFDDVQWLDRDSAEALHHVMQRYQGPALRVLLGARGGELPDNPAMLRVLRSLRRDRKLQELELEPLAREDVARLVGELSEEDLDRVMHASAGNPLYALELVRGATSSGIGATPTLVELVRERVNRLSDTAADVLRWGAVLGYAFDAERAQALTELPQMEVVDALEELERHALLHIDATRASERYTFSHDIVREAAYGELSLPRKRLMHRKVARMLQEQATKPDTAHEVARHASLAGEQDLGVRACITAARYALRSCANSDAEALARRGLHHAAALDDAPRVEAELELLHVLYSARAPDREEATKRVRALAERALDLGLTRAARVGFQMLSYLRWESSSMTDAHENILQAERVSRSADPDERSQALAHAARCLVLLERNLGQAEAFLMEARGVNERSGRSSAAVAFALAMIAAHRGEGDVADAAFGEARDLSRASGERLAELGALEHRLMLALDHGELVAARGMARDLVQLAARVRPGAEVAIAAALHALTETRAGSGDAASLLSAIDGLRKADAKYELAYLLTRRALDLLELGARQEASHCAEEALQVATAIGRASECVIANAVRTLSSGSERADLGWLDGLAEGDLSAIARMLLQRVRAASPMR